MIRVVHKILLLRRSRMKKLSFILALVITVTGAAALFCPAYAAEVTTLTVDGVTTDAESGIYPTLCGAIDAIKDSTDDHAINITAQALASEGLSGIEIKGNLTIYSELATAPEITYGGSSLWLKITGEKTLTLKNLNISAASSNTLFSPTEGATVRLEGCTVTSTASVSTSSAIFMLENSSLGHVEIDDTDITAEGMIILGKSLPEGEATRVTISNGSNITSNSSGIIKFNKVSRRKNYFELVIDSSTVICESNCVASKVFGNDVRITNSTLQTNNESPLIFLNAEYASEINVFIEKSNVSSTSGNTSSQPGIRANAGSGYINISGTTFSTIKNNCVLIAQPTDTAFTDAAGNTISTSEGITVTTCNSELLSSKDAIAVETDATSPTTIVEYVDGAARIAAEGAQLLSDTEATSDKTSVRIVLNLVDTELSSYSEVGAWVSKHDRNVIYMPEATPTVKSAGSTDVVYSSIKADGVRVESTSGYFALLEVKDIPQASFGETVYVRPYVVSADGSSVFLGEALSFSVSGLLS